jgi:hypothetical protein
MPEAATTAPKQAPAATVTDSVKEAIKSVAGDTAEVVETMAADAGKAQVTEHDEL